MANIVSKGRIEYANDSITAGLVIADTDTRAAIRGEVAPLVAETLTDPAVSGIVTDAVDVAVPAAVATELTTQRIVKAGDAATPITDNSVTAITSQSGYLILGLDHVGDLSTWTKDFFGRQVAHRYEGPKLPGVRDIWLTPTGYADAIWYDNGSVEFPGLINAGGSSDGNTFTEQVGSDTYIVNITTGTRTKVVPTDRTILVDTGSSTAVGLATRFETLAASHSATSVHRSYAGTGAEHAFAGLGSRPLVLSAGVTIAASGNTAVTSTNVPMSIQNAWSVAGYWEGHPEAPGVVFKLGSGGVAAFTFTRDAAGSSFALASGARFFPATPKNAITVINPGKNNTTALTGVTTDIGQVLAWCDEAYEWSTATAKPVVFMNHYTDTLTSSVSSNRYRLDQLNAGLAKYGKRCMDLRGYITGSQVWVDTGLTPTSDDLAEQALGNKPQQLSKYDPGVYPTGTLDPLHMSPAAYDAVMAHVIKPTLETVLNWY